MGNVRTRITNKVGPVRTTTSWGGKRGITTSTSYGLKGNMRTTYSTNQKTGKSRTTQSMKVGQNSWYVTSKTTGGFPRKRKSKGKASDLFWTLMIIGIIILIAL